MENNNIINSEIFIVEYTNEPPPNNPVEENIPQLSPNLTAQINRCPGAPATVKQSRPRSVGIRG